MCRPRYIETEHRFIDRNPEITGSVDDQPTPHAPSLRPTGKLDNSEVFRLRNVALSFVQEMAEERVAGDKERSAQVEQMLWEACGEALQRLHDAGHPEPRAYIHERLAVAINDVRALWGVAA